MDKMSEDSVPEIMNLFYQTCQDNDTVLEAIENSKTFPLEF